MEEKWREMEDIIFNSIDGSKSYIIFMKNIGSHKWRKLNWIICWIFYRFSMYLQTTLFEIPYFDDMLEKG